MDGETKDGLLRFVKDNFKPIKIKGAENHYIGRRTADWLGKQRGGARLSHLTPELLDEITASYDLKVVAFDDGNTYIVYPGAELEIMEEFFSAAGADGIDEGDIYLKDAAPFSESDLLERYRISEAAIFELTGETPEDLELTPESAIDFISADSIEGAIDRGDVKIFFEDGIYTVISSQEETPELENYTLYLERLLIGCEVSVDELELSQRTRITGTYRDQVGGSKEEI